MNIQFGSSGIRGKYPREVNPAVASGLGRLLPAALGPDLALGRDTRFSGAVLKASFVSAAIEEGARIHDYDLIPTPTLAYETRSQGAHAGLMITASHNPPEYNGFKIFNSAGEALVDSDSLKHRAPVGTSPRTWMFPQQIEPRQPNDYVSRLLQIPMRKKWKVVIDPGNGATCKLAATIYRKILGEVTAINSFPDGGFTARGSEPSPASMKMLGAVVAETGADAGIGFDGDGDRLFVVDEKGGCPLQDRVLAAYISNLARKYKGPFLVPLDASMAIDEVAERLGARVVRGPVGDALLLQEMKQLKANFAGEPSGAWIHADFHPCPDGILSGLLFLKSIEENATSVCESLEPIPEYHMIRKSLKFSGYLTGKADDAIAQGLRKLLGRDSSTDSKHGLRVSSDRSWVLVRKSGTEPVIRVTVESRNLDEAARLIRKGLRLVRWALKGQVPF